jgi:hypothetical protein
VEEVTDMREQVRHETAGGLLAFRVATREKNLCYWTLVMRNNSAGGLAVLLKGSATSDFLHHYTPLCGHNIVTDGGVHYHNIGPGHI